jgi:hypothetical protein
VDSLYVDAGACPFECCHYGRWRAKAPVRLYARPDSTAPEVGRVDSGVVVDALTGEVHVRPGRFVLERPVGGFAAGETLSVYTPVGEGHYRVRRAGDGGALTDAGLEEPDPSCGAGRASCAGTFLSAPRWVWWAQLRGPGAPTGWTAETRSFVGPDACSGEHVSARHRRLRASGTAA